MKKFVQFSSLQSTAFFEKFKLIPVFESVTCELLESGSVNIIHYTHRYFAVDKKKFLNKIKKKNLGMT